MYEILAHNVIIPERTSFSIWFKESPIEKYSWFAVVASARALCTTRMKDTHKKVFNF